MQNYNDVEPSLFLPALHEKVVNGEVLSNKDKVTPQLSQNDHNKFKSSLWYLDNETSNHMNGEKGKF